MLSTFDTMLKAQETQTLPFPPLLFKAISEAGVAFLFLPSFRFICFLVLAPSSVPM